jgi:hypothetical protein
VVVVVVVVVVGFLIRVGSRMNGWEEIGDRKYG